MISMATDGTRSRGANPSSSGTATAMTKSISRLSDETLFTTTSDAAMKELFAVDGPALLCVDQDAELL